MRERRSADARNTGKARPLDYLNELESRGRRWHSFVALLRDGRWLTRSRIFGYATALIAATVAVMTWVLSGRGMADPMGRPIGTDFLRLWTASYALLNGQQSAIYELARFFALEHAVTQPGT